MCIKYIFCKKKKKKIYPIKNNLEDKLFYDIFSIDDNYCTNNRKKNNYRFFVMNNNHFI